MKRGFLGLLLASLTGSVISMSSGAITDKPITMADALDHIRSTTERLTKAAPKQQDIEPMDTIPLKPRLTPIKIIPGLDEDTKDIDQKPKNALRPWEGTRSCIFPRKRIF